MWPIHCPLPLSRPPRRHSPRARLQALRAHRARRRPTVHARTARCQSRSRWIRRIRRIRPRRALAESARVSVEGAGTGEHHINPITSIGVVYGKGGCWGTPCRGPPPPSFPPPCTSPEPAPPASDLPTRLTARAKPPLTQWAPPTGSSAPAPYPHLLARTTAPPAVRPLHLSHCPSRKPGVHKRPAHQQLPPPAQAGPLRSTAAATSRHAARPCSVMAARPLYQKAAGSPGSSPGMVTRWRLLHLGFIPKQC